MTILLNTDPLRADYLLAEVAGLKPSAQRVSIRPGFHWGRFIDESMSVGVEVWAGLFGEAEHGFSSPETAYDWWAPLIAPRVPVAMFVNEFDGLHGGSSQVMSVAEVNRRLRYGAQVFRQHNPRIRIIGPACISGDPARLDGVDLSVVDAIDVHPYGHGYPLPGQPGQKLTGLLRAYAMRKPSIVVGEWWNDPRETRFALQEPAVTDLAWWLHDPEEADPAKRGQLGIRGKPALMLAFQEIAQEVNTTVPDVLTPAEIAWGARWRGVRPNAVYMHTWGLETAWRANADAWGYPLTDTEEQTTVGGKVVNCRTFSKIGLVYWDPAAGAKVLGWVA